VITARIQNWYELDIPAFTREVFDWYDAAPSDNDPLTLEIMAPQLDALVALVRAQSARGAEQKIVLGQRRAVSYAVHRMKDIQMVGAQLLKSGPKKFGPADIINNTINCIDMFLRLCFSELTHHLGNYQLAADPPIFTGSYWFEYERLPEISQFVYQQPVLLEVYVRRRESESPSAEVYLPLGILPDEYGLVEGDRILSSIWAKIVVPQMAVRKMSWPESLLELDPRCCFLHTHDKKWHGSKRYDSDESWEQTDVELDLGP